MTGLLLLVSLLLCVDMVGHYADYCEADRGDGVCTIIEQYDETQSPTERNNLLLTELQRYRMSLDMKPNTVDDQYIGCSDTLETEVMPKVLRQETSLNPAFRLAWNLGEKEWKKRRTSVRLPGDFRDEFGIAIIVYTSDWPEGNPIYKVFNTHVSLMGISREQYMKEFHFKALHFYITRALQVLKKTSTRRHRVFRAQHVYHQQHERIVQLLQLCLFRRGEAQGSGVSYRCLKLQQSFPPFPHLATSTRLRSPDAAPRPEEQKMMTEMSPPDAGHPVKR